MNPIQLFKQWFEQELSLTTVSIPTACCLSTNGLDDYPNARFVSLKEILNDCFVITGPITSRKGQEIEKSNKVALTFWWTATERQVRLQGTASLIPDQQADIYFRNRSLDSQIVSLVSEQGKEVGSIDSLTEKYNNLSIAMKEKELKRPINWGGFSIEPIRIEFLEFKTSRFHDRKLFIRSNSEWTMKQLQP